MHGKCIFCHVHGEVVIGQDDIEWDYKQWYDRWFDEENIQAREEGRLREEEPDDERD